MYLIAVILILNVLDIYNTLYILERGGHELNPLMAYAMSHSVSLFVIIKLGLTTLGVLTLYYFHAKILYIFMYIYIILILYQLYIITYVINL